MDSSEILLFVYLYFHCMCVSEYLFSNSHITFPKPTSMNFSHRIYYINSSKAPSRTTSLHGLTATSRLNIQHRRHRKSLMIMIGGKFIDLLL